MQLLRSISVDIDIYSSCCCVGTWGLKKKRLKKKNKERMKETNNKGKKNNLNPIVQLSQRHVNT